MRECFPEAVGFIANNWFGKEPVQNDWKGKILKILGDQFLDELFCESH